MINKILFYSPIRSKMKAVRVHEFGGPQVLKVETDVPVPSYTESQVTIKTFVAVEIFTNSLIFTGIDSRRICGSKPCGHLHPHGPLCPAT